MKTKLKDIILGTGDVKGATFVKVKESDTAYIYKRDDKYWEVFKKKEVPVCIDFENRIYSETDTKELYPKKTDFGVWAWFYSIEKNAFNKFNEL